MENSWFELVTSIAKLEDGMLAEDKAAVEQVRSWHAAIFGLSAMFYGFLLGHNFPKGFPIMCEKSGCKRGGSIEKDFLLSLCSDHEMALRRLPEIRQFSKEKYLHDINTSAYIRVGRATEAHKSGELAWAAEEKIFAAAAAWAAVPVEVPAPVSVPVDPPAPAPDPTAPTEPAPLTSPSGTAPDSPDNGATS